MYVVCSTTVFCRRPLSTFIGIGGGLVFWGKGVDGRGSK